MPKISTKLKKVTPNGGDKCRLNTVAVAENWRHSTRSNVNLVRSHVYHTEVHLPVVVCSTFAVMQSVARVCQRHLIIARFNSWANVCKTVRHMLLDRCLSCPVCDVGALCPNGYMDQDETWHGCMPRPRPHCVDGDPAYLPFPKGAQPPNFRPMSVVTARLDGSRYHLIRR